MVLQCLPRDEVGAFPQGRPERRVQVLLSRQYRETWGLCHKGNRTGVSSWRSEHWKPWSVVEEGRAAVIFVICEKYVFDHSGDQNAFLMYTRSSSQLWFMAFQTLGIS